jgi:hypothetical protein
MVKNPITIVTSELALPAKPRKRMADVMMVVLVK